MQREFHPVANIFPLMVESEIADLAADIKAHGLRESIWLEQDGKIIDGRNRFVACQRAKVEPTFRTWSGEGSLIEFVVSLNLKRRHLNESQRGMVAAEIANLKRGHVATQKAEVEISTPIITVPEAAAMLNVSRDTVFHAKTVLKEGTPEEIAAVKRGEAAASTVAKQIRQNHPKEKRRASREVPLAARGNNPERIQARQMRALIWGQFRGALDALTSLPSPADVLVVIAENDRSGNYVDARLSRALNWLKDFSNEWSNRDQDQAGAKAGDHHAHAGNGERAA